MTLRQSTVALLGCGSIGASVAINLAHAGVAKLILVDPQTFTGANVGRHPLGVRSIAAAKASELAKRIRADLPHVEVESLVSKVQDLLVRPDGPLDDVDLIVSALGDWPAESMLDEWHATSGKPFPIVYGWTEPHAAAGHAVIISASGRRLRDGLNDTGQPHLVATQWSEDTRGYEPACGAAFEPYGPVELGFITHRWSPRRRSIAFSARPELTRIACGWLAGPSSKPPAVPGARRTARSRPDP